VVKDDNFGEDRDPLLVRPYLLHDSGKAPADDESTQTWPAATTWEVPSQRAADEPTAVLALPAAPEKRHARPVRRRLVLLSVVGAVIVLIVGVAGLAALRSGPPPVSALPAEPLPAATGPQPTSAQASTATGREATTTTAATPRTATGRTRTTPAATRTSGTAPTTKGSPSGQTVQPAVSNGQEAAAPAAGRTGVIRGQNGVCLDGSPSFGIDRIRVSRCDGSGEQNFTLAADGTLQVGGKCTEVAFDSTVHTDGCDSRGTAKWRTSGQLLINTENNRCLTDTSSSRITTQVMVLPCGGSATQRWSLP
jgi:hypothetical protein